MPKDIRIVSSDLVVDERTRYEQIWRAVRLLSTLPPDKAVSVPTDKHSAYIISKKAHYYAKRYQMLVMTKHIGDEVVICERRNEKKISMTDLAKRCMRNAADRYMESHNEGMAG